jgi:hypothetical protein
MLHKQTIKQNLNVSVTIGCDYKNLKCPNYVNNNLTDMMSVNDYAVTYFKKKSMKLLEDITIFTIWFFKMPVYIL